MPAIRTFLEAKTHAEMARATQVLEREFGRMHEEKARAKVKASLEWAPDLQLLCIRRYVESREQYLEMTSQLLRRDFNESLDLEALLEEPEPDNSLGYHLALMWLTENMGGDTKPLLDQFFSLARMSDVEPRGIGSALLKGCAHLDASHLNSVLSIFDQHGAWEHPFNVGHAFIRILQSSPDSPSRLAEAGRLSSKNVKQCVLSSFTEAGWFPDDLKSWVLALCSDPDPDISSHARACASMKADLAGEITPLIHAGLHAKEWWVRGKCATACGNLTPDPDTFIPLLASLANDFEGHDWNTGECAVWALGKYGQKALPAIPAIRNALKEWGEADDEDGSFAEICKQAITSITPRKTRR